MKGKRVLGTVVGGASGAALGSWIGCKLQLNDQRKAQRALERAAAEGKSQQWSNAETGASGAAIVRAGGVGGLRFPGNVQPYSQYDARAGRFTASGHVNLRAAPTASSAIVGSLNPGENVDVVAGAANAPWLLVAQDGIARGYVSAPLMVQKAANSSANCRLIRQEVRTANEASVTQDYNACPDDRGGWQLSQA